MNEALRWIRHQWKWEQMKDENIKMRIRNFCFAGLVSFCVMCKKVVFFFRKNIKKKLIVSPDAVILITFNDVNRESPPSPFKMISVPDYFYFPCSLSWWQKKKVIVALKHSMIENKTKLYIFTKKKMFSCFEMYIFIFF